MGVISFEMKPEFSTVETRTYLSVTLLPILNFAFNAAISISPPPPAPAPFAPPAPAPFAPPPDDEILDEGPAFPSSGFWPNRFIAAKAASRLAPNGRFARELEEGGLELDADDTGFVLADADADGEEDEDIDEDPDGVLCFARSLARRGLVDFTPRSLESSCCCARVGCGAAIGVEVREGQECWLG